MSNSIGQSWRAGGLYFTLFSIVNATGTEVLAVPGKRVIGAFHTWTSAVSPDQPKYLFDAANGTLTMSAIAASSTGVVTVVSA